MKRIQEGKKGPGDDGKAAGFCVKSWLDLQ